MSDPDPFDYPCDFPIKALGSNTEDFPALVLELVRKHVPDLDEASLSVRPSRAGSYASVTVQIRATSRAQLDAIYQELSAHKRVVMSL